MPQDPDQNVLYRLMPVAEVARTIGRPVEEVERTIAGATAKMQEARARRPVPFVDPARYGLINGALIGALSRAGRFLGDPRPIASARRAADAFLERGFDRARGVAHRLGTDGGHGFGLLEDNAAFALGLVELAGATAEPRYAVAAGQLLSLISGSFSDGSGVLTDVAPALYEGPVVGALDEPVHPIEDAPNLSPNALVAIALVRWSSLAQDDSALDRARALVEGLARRLDGAGIFAAGAAWAGGLAETPPARVVIEGDGPAAEALARAAERGFHPNLWVFRGPPPAPFSMPEELARAAAGRSTGARALVCFGTRCRAPITDPAELAAAIASADRPSR